MIQPTSSQHLPCMLTTSSLMCTFTQTLAAIASHSCISLVCSRAWCTCTCVRYARDEPSVDGISNCSLFRPCASARLQLLQHTKLQTVGRFVVVSCGCIEIHGTVPRLVNHQQYQASRGRKPWRIVPLHLHTPQNCSLIPREGCLWHENYICPSRHQVLWKLS